jgi:drug/metabolite transporter (DMT)-like permease
VGWVPWLILFTALVVMGGQFAVGKLGLAAGLTPGDIVALRFVGASVVALPVVLGRGLPSLGGVGWGRGVALALVAGSPYALLLYAALEFAPAAHGAMLVPGVGLIVATVIGAAWVGERHGPTRYLGAAVVLVGLVILGSGGSAGPGATWIGDALFAVVGVAWGLFTLLIRRWHLDALAAVAALSILSLGYLPVYALVLEPRVLAVAPSASLLQAAYQGVLQTMVAFVGYAFAVRRLGAGTASVATAVVPVFGVLLAIPLIGEWPSPSAWLGLATVGAGIALANVASSWRGLPAAPISDSPARPPRG